MPRIWFARMQTSNFGEDALCIQGCYVLVVFGL
jgi:hypothetical protein